MNRMPEPIMSAGISKSITVMKSHNFILSPHNINLPLAVCVACVNHFSVPRRGITGSSEAMRSQLIFLPAHQSGEVRSDLQ